MKNVVIIGAGPAGLTAAYKLLEESEDYNVTIIEESGEIGGISQTVRYKNHYMDLGGHRFFSKDKNVMDFWEKFMPIQGVGAYDDIQLARPINTKLNGPNPENADDVMLLRRRVSRIYYNHKFFDYPVTIKWDTFKNMGIMKSIIAGFSYLKATLVKRKEMSLEDFYINRFGRKLYSMFFEGYTEKLWGRHPSEISADWGAQRVKGLSITEIIKDMFAKAFHCAHRKVETSLIEEFYYPKYGPGQLWEKLSDEIRQKGGDIIRNAKVIEICGENNEILGVLYQTEDKKIYKLADILISSMPLKDLVLSMNEVPEKIVGIAKELPYRDFVTMGILVSKLKLVNRTKMTTLSNIIPDCWIYIQDCSVKLGRIQIFNNWSPYLVEKPEETVWIGTEYFCNENDDFWNMSEEEMLDFVVNELIEIGVIDNKSEVLQYHRKKVKKAYPAYFDSYNQIDDVIDYVNKINNLYCIGRNGQHRYNNMDHSMVTAFETVSNILNNKESKQNIWQVNTEKTYHEE